ncbi:MAG TPA: topoisomerase C-terminal repeat-containing protein, partial [Geminicoccaceae bacterium]|nr:topoisomerase C-terminal repeat-containing protein [Geminicoccaceae bacterium]
ENKRFRPEDRGRLVTAFLVAFFDQYVQPEFTAALEDRLDDVAAGGRHWKQVLREFWDPFSGVVDEVKERRVAEVIDALNELLGPHFFPPREDGGDPRQCPLCGKGRLSLKLGRYGAFVGCSNYPECRFTRRLGTKAEEEPDAELKERLIGVDPMTREEVVLKRGPYGPYVQRGQGDTIRRSSLPPGLEPADLDLDTALALLALPREIGRHPESGAPIEAGINRYGPYIKHDRFVRLGPQDDVLSIGMNRAIALLAEAGSRQRAAPKQLRELGAHPKDGKPVSLHQGRFGPYVKHGKENASLRKAHDPDRMTLEEAVQLLAERAAKGKAAKGTKAKPAAGSKGGGKGAGKAGDGSARRAAKRVATE